MFTAHLLELTTHGQPLRIHLFSTGRGRDKTRFRESRFRGPISLIDAILDQKFTEYLPIWVMAVEHPEGAFLIDTGAGPELAQKEYFRPAGRLVQKYISTQFRFEVAPADTVDHQLKALGIDKLTSVILTHLHFDHIDGLRYLPRNIPVLVNRQEWQHPFGNLPRLYPKNFQPALLDLTDRLGPFFKARFLTQAQDIALIHTPGHTYGHCSVLIWTDTVHILFAGDTCYSQDQLILDRFAANLASNRQSRHTYAAIKSYAHTYPTIFLPAHDPASGQRLANRQLLVNN